MTVGLAVEIKSRFQIFSGVVWRLTKKTIGKNSTGNQQWGLPIFETKTGVQRGQPSMRLSYLSRFSKYNITGATNKKENHS